MARARTEIKPHLSSAQLKERYLKCQSTKEARRWHALWLISTGLSTTAVGEIVGFQGSWVRRFLNRYNAEGPEAIIDGHRQNPGGGKRRLSEKQVEQLRQALDGEPPGGGFWTGPKVALWIASKTKKMAHPQLGWVYLRYLNKSSQAPRRQHQQTATPKERGAYKKKLTREVKKLRVEHPRSRLEVWAHDQARRGLKPIVRRVWVTRGERPMAISPHIYEWTYAYGFVHPKSGRTHWLIMPEVSTNAMGLALSEFAVAHGIGRRKEVLLVVDGAAWHTSRKLELPKGLHLLPLPRATPEMQPAERLWPLLNEGLANRPFTQIKELEKAMARRCRQLVKQEEEIRKLTEYHWWPDY